MYHSISNGTGQPVNINVFNGGNEVGSFNIGTGVTSHEDLVGLACGNVDAFEYPQGGSGRQNIGPNTTIQADVVFDI